MKINKNITKNPENIDFSPANMQGDFLGLPKIYTQNYIEKILKKNNSSLARTQNILIRHPKIQDGYTGTEKEQAPLKNPENDIDEIYKNLEKIIGNNFGEFLVVYSSKTARISELKEGLKNRGLKAKFVEDKNIFTWDRENYNNPKEAILKENGKQFLEFMKKYDGKNLIILSNSTFAGLYYSMFLDNSKDKMTINPNLLGEGEIGVYNFDNSGKVIQREDFLNINYKNIDEIIFVLKKIKEFSKVISDFKEKRINFLQFTNSINLVFSEKKYLYSKVLEEILQNFNLRFSYKDLINFCLYNILENEKRLESFQDKNFNAVFKIPEIPGIGLEKLLKIFDILRLEDLGDFLKQIDNSSYRGEFISKIKNDNLDDKSKIISYYLSGENSLYSAFLKAKENNFEIKIDVNLLKSEIENLFNSLFDEWTEPDKIKENLEKLKKLIEEKGYIEIFDINIEENNSLKDYLEMLFLEKFEEIIYKNIEKNDREKVVNFGNMEEIAKKIRELEKLENKFFEGRNNLGESEKRYDLGVDKKQIFFATKWGASVNNLEKTIEYGEKFFNNQKGILKSNINKFYEKYYKRQNPQINQQKSFFENIFKIFEYF